MLGDAVRSGGNERADASQDHCGITLNHLAIDAGCES
jgi:hypothetical protein